MDKLARRVLDYIKSYALENNYLPTAREIAEALETNMSSVHNRMVMLELRGYIKRSGHRYTVTGLKYVLEE